MRNTLLGVVVLVCVAARPSPAAFTLFPIHPLQTLPASDPAASMGGGITLPPVIHGYSLSYLEWRHSLDPSRFDYYHPKLGPLLEQGGRVTAATSQQCPPVNGLLPDTPFYNYMRWRRSLNPARFDHYHPNLGPALAEDALLRSQGAMCSPGSMTSTGGTTTQPVPQLPQSGGTTGGGTTGTTVKIPHRVVHHVRPPSGGSGKAVHFHPLILPPLGNLVSIPSGSPGGVGIGVPPQQPIRQQAVPEPSGLILLSIGSTVGGAVALRRRRRWVSA